MYNIYIRKVKRIMINEMIKIMFSNRRDGKRVKRLAKKWVKLVKHSIKEINKLSPDGQNVLKELIQVAKDSLTVNKINPDA